MAKYSSKARQEITKTMHTFDAGKLKSGRSHKKVSSQKQAIAIGIEKARNKKLKVPERKNN